MYHKAHIQSRSVGQGCVHTQETDPELRAVRGQGHDGVAATAAAAPHPKASGGMRFSGGGPSGSLAVAPAGNTYYTFLVLEKPGMLAVGYTVRSVFIRCWTSASPETSLSHASTAWHTCSQKMST